MENEHDDPAELLKGAPPNAPGWILGLAFFVCVFLSNFVSTWLAISPDVKQYLANRKEIEVAEIGAKQTREREERETLLSLAAKHSEQYALLAHSIEIAAIRASDAEKEIGQLRAQLEECKNQKTATEIVREVVGKSDEKKKP